jgi:hypothetical protein
MKTPQTVIARNEATSELCQSGNGHIVLSKMLLAFVLCFFLSLNAFAQSKDTTTKAQPLDSTVNKEAMYVIDGVLSHNKLNGIDPHDILSINVIKPDTAYKYFDGPIRNGLVAVVTKQGAIKSYQKKFSAFSKKYKDYLEKHNSDDNNLIYILNGVQVSANTDEKIRSLYGLKTDSIKNIVFISTPGADSVPVQVVAIATK